MKTSDHIRPALNTAVHVFVSAALQDLWKRLRRYERQSVSSPAIGSAKIHRTFTGYSQKCNLMLHHRCENRGPCVSDHFRLFLPMELWPLLPCFSQLVVPTVLVAHRAFFWDYRTEVTWYYRAAHPSPNGPTLPKSSINFHVFHICHLKSKYFRRRERSISYLWWSMASILLLQVPYMLEVLTTKGKSDSVGHDTNARARMLDGRTRSFKAAVARFGFRRWWCWILPLGSTWGGVKKTWVLIIA